MGHFSPPQLQLSKAEQTIRALLHDVPGVVEDVIGNIEQVGTSVVVHDGEVSEQALCVVDLLAYMGMAQGQWSERAKTVACRAARVVLEDFNMRQELEERCLWRVEDYDFRPQSPNSKKKRVILNDSDAIVGASQNLGGMMLQPGQVGVLQGGHSGTNIFGSGHVSEGGLFGNNEALMNAPVGGLRSGEMGEIVGLNARHCWGFPDATLLGEVR